MGFHKSIGSLTVLAGILSLSPALYGFANLNAPNTWLSPSPNLQANVNFPDSPGGSGPRRSAGAGSRSGDTCSIVHDAQRGEFMTVLMPSNNLGTTAKSDAPLYIFIPESKVEAVEVSIFDNETRTQELYQESFDLANKPDGDRGIVKVDLDGLNLEPGKTYYWTFRPFCLDEAGDPKHINPELFGLFQRQALTPEQQMELDRASTPREKAEAYAKEGLWNEALEIAEQLRRSDPDAWTELLTSVELPEEIVEAPYFGEAQPITQASSPTLPPFPVNSPREVDRNEPVPAPSTANSPQEESRTTSTPIRGLW